MGMGMVIPMEAPIRINPVTKGEKNEAEMPHFFVHRIKSVTSLSVGFFFF